jgi:hypothetical protein
MSEPLTKSEKKPGLIYKAKKAAVNVASAVTKKAGNLFGKVKSVFKGNKKGTPPTPPTTSSYQP